MTICRTIQIGEKPLKAKNKHIGNVHNPIVKKVIRNLIDTMYDAQLIGIAAPQIGENYHIFITEPRETDTRSKDQSDILRIYINPKIVAYSKKQVTIWEGCGSLADGAIFGPIKRPAQVTVEAFDEQGRRFRFTADGILGRVIQHEVDHLHGVEFIEKIEDNKRLVSADVFVKTILHTPQHKKASEITVKKLEQL
ncbi:peptide deformylase [Candidatus Woesebacteria bacterium]|nr:peptide deformylase [Candidatus Woesebacteria bacterium]